MTFLGTQEQRKVEQEELLQGLLGETYGSEEQRAQPLTNREPFPL